MLLQPKNLSLVLGSLVTYPALAFSFEKEPCSGSHPTTPIVRSTMPLKEPTLMDGLMLPDRESILDVMAGCDCSEERATNLLQVSSSCFEAAQMLQ